MGIRSVIGAIPGVRSAVRMLHRGYESALRAATPTTENAPWSEEVQAIMRVMRRRNRGHDRITDPNGVVAVTMTTHSDRLRHVWAAIESIGAGDRLPRRITLWLDNDQAYRNLPVRIRRLQRRGLEVRLVQPGLKVHTKWYPMALTGERPVVTADDDILYPTNWLSRLLAAHEEHPDDVLAFRAHQLVVEDNALTPYMTLQPTAHTRASFANLGTSVSGQLFPGTVMDAAVAEGTAFLELAPDSDDLWLHAVAVRAGVRVRQVTDRSEHYTMVPGTQHIALNDGNVYGGNNDKQAARIYGPAEIAAIRDDAEAL